MTVRESAIVSDGVSLLIEPILLHPDWYAVFVSFSGTRTR